MCKILFKKGAAVLEKIIEVHKGSPYSRYISNSAYIVFLQDLKRQNLYITLTK